jgi:hypothetical protein
MARIQMARLAKQAWSRPSLLPVALLALGVAGVLPAGPAAAAERLVEGIAAQVGGEIILVSEVMEMAGPVEERMRAAGAPEQ